MEYRKLKLNVISAEGLKNANLFSKMDLYCKVSLAGYPKSKQMTFIDKDCGTKPNWNHRMEFVIDEPYLTKPGLVLLFQIKKQGSFLTDKEIGSVAVPIEELFHSNPSTQEQIVDYQVRTKTGKAKGMLKFSYKFEKLFTHQVEANKPAVVPMAAYPPNKHAGEPVTAYPAHVGASGYPNKHGNEPVTAYAPGGYPASSSGYGYQAPPMQQGYGYQPQPAGYGYQAPPMQQGYGYQPQPAGYGYPHGPAGYGGYPPVQKPKKNRMGGGLGMGLGAGLLGGLLIGDMVGDASGYADGYGDAMGGGDFGGMDF